jgi:hypothetical protein
MHTTPLQVIDQLDFRNNRRQLLSSYLIRLAGVFLFGFLFHYLLNTIRGEFSMATLLNVEIERVGAVWSILLLMLDIVLVLYLHELLHAAVYYFSSGQKTRIGIRGLVIFAAAPDKLISRSTMLINAWAPFVVISLLGIWLMLIVPEQAISWVFIPTLVNAAAAGGDFMVVYFVLKHSRQTQYRDVGDIINALEITPPQQKAAG